MHHLPWLEVAREEWPDIAMIVTYVSLLNVDTEIPNLHSLLDIHAYSRTHFLDAHNVGVLLVAFTVYLYKDVWPLATYTPTPIDASEGSLVWAKLGVLSFMAAFIPLFIPCVYEPVGPHVCFGGCD